MRICGRQNFDDDLHFYLRCFLLVPIFFFLPLLFRFLQCLPLCLASSQLSSHLLGRGIIDLPSILPPFFFALAFEFLLPPAPPHLPPSVPFWHPSYQQERTVSYGILRRVLSPKHQKRRRGHFAFHCWSIIGASPALFPLGIYVA